ncbi:MAG: hypothetical protein GWM98_21555 [Nitrospinaceae bacterium]|nr:hypothetical protein [Nitrospinaceae bacterium]NIR56571.1 hypothetical protein [Nitrospinaceae bacterium]NIS87033.1 hypothetical protein [Nitrospinaceae bacterium]NIT83877.1 hypothetical protein [Nitrospinaceae bacterium]NIU46080.1 hypothetical protein [Nitrospinaceae bacterium]
MNDSQGSDRDFERLSKAITEAVMSSEKVKRIVADIQKKEKICPQSFMVLVLKMQVLTESLELEVQEDVADKKPLKKRGRKKASEQPQYIDGRKLTKKEIEFEEFSRTSFDAESWLKKNRLIF